MKKLLHIIFAVAVVLIGNAMIQNNLEQFSTEVGHISQKTIVKTVDNNGLFIDNYSEKYQIESNEINEYNVYRTRTGKKYHRYGCSYLRSSCIKITAENAENTKLTPCSICNP